MQLLPDMTNTQVVERLRAGDDLVFSRLYETCYRMVYFQAMKILDNEDEADSVVQDVFITVFRSIDKLTDPEALRSWIGGIAVRLSLKRRQRLRSSREFALEDEAMMTILDTDGGTTPEERLLRQDTGRILGELVDELPQEQRETVMLFYYDQCAVREIAQIMSCAEGTVKSRLNYARRQLEKLIFQREQRDGVRLHAINPALLFLAFALQEQQTILNPETVRRGLEAVRAALGLAAGGAAAAAGSTAAGGAAGAASGGSALSGTAQAAGAVISGAGTAAGGVGGKVAALIVAGALLAGTGGALITQLPPPEQTPPASQSPAAVIALPSAAPTVSPTAAPSPVPTPTPTPSAAPSATPSPGPTPSATASPTPPPTASPAPRPTARPTATPRPSVRPTATPRPTPTPAPTGDYFSNYYREDYRDGQYLSLQLSGTTLTATGMRVLDQGLYNYIVLRTTGNEYYVPFVSGQPFSLSVEVSIDILHQIEAKKPGSPYAYSGVTLLVCQNYTPGDSAMGGVGFQNSSIGMVAQGNSCIMKIMPR